LAKIFQELSLHKSPCVKQRTPSLCILYVVGGFSNRSLDLLEGFIASDRTWKSLAPLPKSRSGLGGAFLGGLFYAVGGREVTREVREGFGCRDVDAYDPVTNQWQKRSALIYPRHRPGVAVLDGYLYAVGGVVDKSHRNSVERYNPERDQWELVASMSCPRVGVAAAVMNRLLYAIGGLNETEKLSSVECFHPERNEWITLR
jgi:kelch-like protein 19